MLRLWLVALLLLTPSFAGAAVGVLPVDATAMGADEARTRLAVTEVAKDLLRGKFRALTVVDELQGTAVADCIKTPTCLQAAAERAGVDEVAHIAIARTGERDPWAKATVQMFDSAGERVFVATQVLTTSRTNDVKGLLLQAFEPARYTARLQVLGLMPGDQLHVDGLLADTLSNVRPGQHRVRVAHADGSLTIFDVDVAFEERKQVTVPKRQGGLAVVPAVVGGVAVLGGAAGVALGVFGIGFYGTALQQLDTIADDCAANDDVCASSVRTSRAELDGGRALSTAGALAGGLVAAAGVVVVVAAVAPALFPPTAEEAP